MLQPITSGNDLLVRFTTASGQPHRLETSTDLLTWSLPTDILLGTGATQDFLDSAALTQPRRFYRARVCF